MWNLQKNVSRSSIICKVTFVLMQVCFNIIIIIKNLLSGVKPFKCERCNFSFGAKSNLTRHLRNIHAEQPNHKEGKLLSKIEEAVKQMRQKRRKETFQKRIIGRSRIRVMSVGNSLEYSETWRSTNEQLSAKGKKQKMWGSMKQFKVHLNYRAHSW